MAGMDVALKDALGVEGAIAVAVVDSTSGMALGTAGGGFGFDVTVAAATNTEVLRAKMRTLEMLGMKETVEDILVTLGSQYHLIRPVNKPDGRGLFVYLALHRDRANLAMARHRLRTIEQQLEI
ncbi:MAG: hypothetical protein SYR96_38820 [Actinomycetota bacterium]|nr:hypothetical protein [Actinomycetota bacterium]